MAGSAAAALSAITSVMNLRVPRSMPLAQAITGVAGRITDPSAVAAWRSACAGTTSSTASASPASAIRRRHGDALVEANARQTRVLAGRPQGGVAASRAISVTQRPARADRIGKRAAPRAGAHHRDAFDRHGAQASCGAASGTTGLATSDERPARARRHVERIGQAEREPFGAGPRDHGGVVGAQLGRRHHQHGGGLERDAVQHLADRLVGGDATGGDQRGRLAERVAKHAQAATQPVRHHVDHRLLKRRAQIGDVLVGERSDLLGRQPQRGLQSGQREIAVAAPRHRPRQRETTGVAELRRPLDLRPARIVEPEELRGLVEGFADGVVERGAQPHVIADAAHGDDLGVSAGGEEQAIGERHVIDEAGRERVRLEVVHRDQRLLLDQRDRLGGGQSDDHAADQPGAGRGRNAVELVEVAPGLPHRPADQQVEDLHMGARRDLGYHAAERRMVGDLREHDVRPDLAAPVRQPLDHRGRGLVAGRLDAEDDHENQSAISL